VQAGGQQLDEFLSKQRINRVMLLSDGIANVGPSSNREIAQLGSRLSNYGVSVTTIGLGDDYNETLMTALAEASELLLRRRCGGIAQGVQRRTG